MSEVREETAEQANARLDGYLVVDVREASELTGPLGHIASALHHPLGTLPGALAGMPLDRRMLLVCRSGRRSHDACALLAVQGFTDVTNLAGGMIAWNEAGLPVVSSPPPGQDGSEA